MPDIDRPQTNRVHIRETEDSRETLSGRAHEQAGQIWEAIYLAGSTLATLLFMIIYIPALFIVVVVGGLLQYLLPKIGVLAIVLGVITSVLFWLVPLYVFIDGEVNVTQAYLIKQNLLYLCGGGVAMVVIGMAIERLLEKI